MQNNELIAKYIGMQNTDIGWYDAEGNLSQYVYDINRGNIFDYLEFHKSYDWLMSVVEYIELKGYSFYIAKSFIEIFNLTLSSSKRFYYIKYNRDKLDTLYYAVIQFINGNIQI